jgi:hypothetical protein
VPQHRTATISDNRPTCPLPPSCFRIRRGYQTLLALYGKPTRANHVLLVPLAYPVTERWIEKWGAPVDLSRGSMAGSSILDKLPVVLPSLGPLKPKPAWFGTVRLGTLPLTAESRQRATWSFQPSNEPTLSAYSCAILQHSSLRNGKATANRPKRSRKEWLDAQYSRLYAKNWDRSFRPWIVNEEDYQRGKSQAQHPSGMFLSMGRGSTCPIVESRPRINQYLQIDPRRAAGTQPLAFCRPGAIAGPCIGLSPQCSRCKRVALQ